VHNGFYRAFKHLGYDTYWFDDKDNLNDFDFRNSLFVTIGGQDEKIPLRNDCRYILHNCENQKYERLFELSNCIKLQVYTHDCLTRNVEKIDQCIYKDKEDKTIYMPWATDLLPSEIDANKIPQRQRKRENTVYWIGTVWGSEQGNYNELVKFVKACNDSQVRFRQLSQVSPEENLNLIHRSLMAPAIQGPFQCEKGYIPCRIFKNISYGQIGITNSKTVYELFEKKIVYNENTYQLFFDALEEIKNITDSQLYDLMDFVKNKHTYINRINTLLDFMNELNPFSIKK
jgi:hypothetical protein